MEQGFEIEEQKRKEGYSVIVGVDEAGRGPLAGPVVAAAAAYRDQAGFVVPVEFEKIFRFVRDSKKLSEKKREEMFDFVREHFFVGVGVVQHTTIDRINILEATFLAMKEAIGELKRQALRDKGQGKAIGKQETQNVTSPHGRELMLHFDEGKMVVLVDGNQLIPNLSLSQEAIVDGDALVRSIAAASIIAKVTRDRMMIDYGRQYPAYGFAKHKGYGTKEHMDALRKYGPSPIHRMSFRPVFLSIPENANKRFFGK